MRSSFQCVILQSKSTGDPNSTCCSLQNRQIWGLLKCLCTLTLIEQRGSIRGGALDQIERSGSAWLCPFVAEGPQTGQPQSLNCSSGKWDHNIMVLGELSVSPKRCPTSRKAVISRCSINTAPPPSKPGRTCPERPLARLVLPARSNSRKIQIPPGTGMSDKRASLQAVASPECCPRFPGAGR